MSLNDHVFGLLAKYGDGGKLLAAGWPDMLVTPMALRDHLGRADFAKDPESDRILGDSGGVIGLEYAREAAEVLAAMSYSLDVIDLRPDRGTEHIVDLNVPTALGEYDVVLDHGTLEHCFDVATAAINLASAVRQGGIIIQHLPANMYNHGFYNFNPTWFHDFYDEQLNGFAIQHLDPTLPPVEEFSGFDIARQCFTVVARRSEVKPLSRPVQRRYR